MLAGGRHIPIRCREGPCGVNSQAVSVFIVEDQPATRRMLVEQIEASPGHRVVGAVGTIADARRALPGAGADVLLVDLQLPDGDGVTLIREHAARAASLPVLVISVFGDERRVVEAISAGAQGYLLKDDSGDEIVAAIDRLLRGESPISPAIATHLIRRFRDSGPLAGVQGELETALSGRELEVLQLAAKGLSYRETAELLGVSVNTVGTYTKRIYSKLAVSTRAEAVFEAQQLGLMPGRLRRGE
jgi:DNA-binding NarL/FixJ family response regulator